MKIRGDIDLNKILFLIGAATLSFLAGLLAPAAAELLRSIGREGERHAKETPEEDDDRLWRVVKPVLDRMAAKLDKGDIEGAKADHAEAKAMVDDFNEKKKKTTTKKSGK